VDVATSFRNRQATACKCPEVPCGSLTGAATDVTSILVSRWKVRLARPTFLGWCPQHIFPCWIHLMLLAGKLVHAYVLEGCREDCVSRMLSWRPAAPASTAAYAHGMSVCRHSPQLSITLPACLIPLFFPAALSKACQGAPHSRTDHLQHQPGSHQTAACTSASPLPHLTPSTRFAVATCNTTAS
jgi:hypothetical protein